MEEKKGFTAKNSLTLALLTAAFIIGEISHFLIGTVSKEMANDIQFGNQACGVKEGIDFVEACADFTDEAS